MRCTCVLISILLYLINYRPCPQDISTVALYNYIACSIRYASWIRYLPRWAASSSDGSDGQKVLDFLLAHLPISYSDHVRLNDEWVGEDDLIVILEGKQQYLRTISALLGYWRSFRPLQSLDVRTQGILPPMKDFKYSFGGEFPPNLQARLSVLERELNCDVYHITHDIVTLVSHEKVKPIRTFRMTERGWFDGPISAMVMAMEDASPDYMGYRSEGYQGRITHLQGASNGKFIVLGTGAVPACRENVTARSFIDVNDGKEFELWTERMNLGFVFDSFMKLDLQPLDSTDRRPFLSTGWEPNTSLSGFSAKMRSRSQAYQLIADAEVADPLDYGIYSVECSSNANPDSSIPSTPNFDWVATPSSPPTPGSSTPGPSKKASAPTLIKTTPPSSPKPTASSGPPTPTAPSGPLTPTAPLGPSTPITTPLGPASPIATPPPSPPISTTPLGSSTPTATAPPSPPSPVMRYRTQTQGRDEERVALTFDNVGESTGKRMREHSGEQSLQKDPKRGRIEPSDVAYHIHVYLFTSHYYLIGSNYVII